MSDLINLMDLYNKNSDFRLYVDKYSRCHRMLAEDAIKCKVVQNYADWIRGGKR